MLYSVCCTLDYGVNVFDSDRDPVRSEAFFVLELVKGPNSKVLKNSDEISYGLLFGTKFAISFWRYP